LTPDPQPATAIGSVTVIDSTATSGQRVKRAGTRPCVSRLAHIGAVRNA